MQILSIVVMHLAILFFAAAKANPWRCYATVHRQKSVFKHQLHFIKRTKLNLNISLCFGFTLQLKVILQSFKVDIGLFF